MSIYVNADHTSDQHCKCIVVFSSGGRKTHWIAHWILETERKYGKCSMIRREKGDSKWKNCTNPARLGAHVRKKNRSSSNDQYIVPACSSCNGFKSRNIDFKFKKGVKIVRALARNCRGTKHFNFSITSGKARTVNKHKKRTCKRFGCSVSPQGRKHYCSKHKPVVAKSKTKKSCKKSGCSVKPAGRKHYCSKHR